MSGGREQRKASTAEDRAEGLQVGMRVRYARMLKGVLARELAERVGCTESMISKIENERVVPSLPMLQNIVQALEIDLSTFFGLTPQAASFVLRKGERPITRTDPIRGGTGIHYERLVPFGSGHLLEANIHVIAPGGEKEDDITHQGEAVGYVIEGLFDLTIDGTTYRLEAGDSFFYKAHLTTRYRNPGPSETRVVWVNTPQIH